MVYCMGEKALSAHGSPSAPGAFRGNKKRLPNKTCVSCKRIMTWRKRWEKNWDEVKYCSEACRKAGRLRAGEDQSPR